MRQYGLGEILTGWCDGWWSRELGELDDVCVFDSEWDYIFSLKDIDRGCKIEDSIDSRIR